tara:strand:- start:1833 stop:2588 length:756 start_codon:yes stop_codon:yes gene_type:complete
MKTVNIVCLKWGDVYTPDYVNKLYSMIKRNITLPFRFICLTENSQGIRSEVERWPLPEFEEPPWEYARFCQAWRKLALFKNGLANINGKVLFLDLDVVIMSNIDCFFSFSNKLSIIENWYQPGQLVGQASVICFESGQDTDLLSHYLDEPVKVLKEYRTEQAYITGYLGNDRFDYFPEDWCISFKKHCMPSGVARFFSAKVKEPKAAKIVVFHGRPNPPDAIKGQWGKTLPWYKRWYKRVQASPWVAEHWR